LFFLCFYLVSFFWNWKLEIGYFALRSGNRFLSGFSDNNFVFVFNAGALVRSVGLAARISAATWPIASLSMPATLILFSQP